jgi:hypothetical protein
MHWEKRIAEIAEENIGHLNDAEALTCALYCGVSSATALLPQREAFKVAAPRA